MIKRVYSIGLAVLTVLSSVTAMLIFPQLDPLTGVVGLLVQLAGVVVVGYLRPPFAGLALLLVTVAASWLPTGWQVAYDHQLIVWIPFAAAIASNRVISESRSRPELILGLAPLPLWCLVTIGNADPSPTTVLAGIAPVLGGLCFALLSRLGDARRDRLAALEQERRTAERERLLADLHDVITHRITRVVLRSRQLAAVTEPPVRDGLSEIERTATETLTALRDYLTAARPGEPTTTDHGAGTVADLRTELAGIVAEEQGLGRPVALADHDGDDRTMISSAVRSCLLRAAREALTNAAKHAAESPVMIELVAGRGRVRLAVINEAPTEGPDVALRGSGSGTGLRGLASRCQLLGGALTTGPEPSGGFAVRVDLPAAELAAVSG
ncbi:sensor histidine kinase [Microlunatus parietis]|uniref:histidine kinase n=1 Tax=Microlunatus parietis TaxID=682979 RepID=A0A7Y9I5P8_9ACTN|nr:histidine kinase [Microlunatus parietis]NYE70775.1 signal transduction histidine kinase [Microlunatus parietis]